MAGDFALVEGDDAVGQAEHLVQIGAHQQDGAAGVALLHDGLVDELDGADVHAAGGLGDDEDVRAQAEFPGQHHLLHVAAGEGARRRAHARAANVELAKELSGVLVHRAALEVDPRGGEFLRALLARQQVVLHRGGGGDAGADAVLRDVRKSQPADLAGGSSCDGLSVDEHLAAAHGPHAGDGLDQLALTVALDGGDAQNLARAHGQAHALHGGQHAVGEHLQVLHADALVACLAGLFQLGVEHLAADHHAGQHAFVDLAGVLQAHQLAGAHHAHAVGDRHDLVELVGDDDDRHALVAHDAPDDPEQLVGLLGGQHGGGLVQNQHVRAPVQGLENLHALLQAHAQGIDLGGGVDLQAELLRELAHRVVGGPEVVQAQLLLRLAA